MASELVKNMEIKLWDLLEEYFPKGKNKDRGKALFLIAIAKELGAQGHADYSLIKPKAK